MHIKNLIGARKGEIEDFPYEIAKRKVEAGEAEDVYGQLPKPATTTEVAVVQPAAVSTRVDAVSVHASKPLAPASASPAAKKKTARR
jgi:hypothetical protein